MRDKALFLKWALVNVLFVVGLVAAKLQYHAHVPTPAAIAVAAVLAVYAFGSAWGGYLSWHERQLGHWHLIEAANYCPKVAMLGTVSGFLIAFSGDAGSAAERVRGASTSLIATFVGIACMLVLEAQHHVLRTDSSRVGLDP